MQTAALLATAAAILALTPIASASDRQQAECDGESATIVGTANRDVLTGTARDDVIVALDGNDMISGGRGDDLICAGEGDGASDWLGTRSARLDRGRARLEVRRHPDRRRG